MFESGVDTAPVKTTECLINISAHLNVDRAAFQNFVIYTAQQIEQAALVTGIAMNSLKLMNRWIQAGIAHGRQFFTAPTAEFVPAAPAGNCLIFHYGTDSASPVNEGTNTGNVACESSTISGVSKDIL